MSIRPLWTIYHGAYITLSNTPIMYERSFSSSHYTYVTCNPANVLLMFHEIHWSDAMLLAPDEINSRPLMGKHGIADEKKYSILNLQYVHITFIRSPTHKFCVLKLIILFFKEIQVQ